MVCKKFAAFSLLLLALVGTFTPMANGASFSKTGTMAFGRRRHTATLLGSGKVLVTGGATTAGTLATAEIYDPATGLFTRTGNMQTARSGHTATLLANGKVLITGGTNASGSLATAELFTPATGTFASTGSMKIARVGHTATLLANGEVLITGGGNAKAELFNPTTGAFTSTTDMNAPRMGHVAARLANGKVLLGGGTDGCCTAQGDVFDPTTGAFSLTATGGTQATWLAGASLQDGRVLLAGGEVTVLLGGGSTRCCLYGPDSRSTAVLFQSSNNTFTAAGSMTTSRAFHTATRIPNGQVLIAGGSTVSSVARLDKVVTTVIPRASAELFNPATKAFTLTSNMTTPRAWHTATLLRNGKVLVIGGVDTQGNVLSSAELYF